MASVQKEHAAAQQQIAADHKNAHMHDAGKVAQEHQRGEMMNDHATKQSMVDNCKPKP